MNKDDLPTLRAQSYCKEIRNSPAVTDLANKSAVIPVVESLLGKGNLDGLGSSLNGSSKGTYRHGFTMLAVVLLNHLPETHGGNFTVWPKSHTFFENYFRENGIGVLADGMPQVDLPEDPIQITGQAGDLVIAHIKSSIQLSLTMHLTFAMLLFFGCVTNRRHSLATNLIPIFGENGPVFKGLPINCNRAVLRLVSTHEKRL